MSKQVDSKKLYPNYNGWLRCLYLGVGNSPDEVYHEGKKYVWFAHDRNSPVHWWYKPEAKR